MKKEIVFTAFHRVAYLREAVSSWNQAENIQDWPVSYLLEPTTQPIERAMQNEFNRFESAEISGVVNDRVLGVLRNPYAALTSAFDAGNNFVVLAEDDIIVSDDILEYFEWAMHKYEKDKSVLAVLAYSRNKQENGFASAVARTKVFCPLVWGTWSDRWESIIKPNWDLDYSSGKPDGSEAGWDWNMMRVAVRENMDFIYPDASRSTHIGEFGGTHTSAHDFPDSQAKTFRSSHNRENDFQEVIINDWKLNEYYPGSN